ncbi:hypothetical protein SDC9_129252 [bioreactor metagenome]|uniref:Uncharacterized protein n=1 Tax=bioreactor metagenome TaxID=1076179 RepID=A0A645CZ78_9ZZZZ
MQHLIRARCQPGQRHAKQSPRQITQVIGRGQPTALRQGERAVVQHHRQQRREGEPAYAHGDGQRRHARKGNRPGLERAAGSGLRARCGNGFRGNVLHGRSTLNLNFRFIYLKSSHTKIVFESLRPWICLRLRSSAWWHRSTA